MQTKAMATSTGTQKFEFTADSPVEEAALKAFERVLKTTRSIQAIYQETERTLNVVFQITSAELGEWEKSRHKIA